MVLLAATALVLGCGCASLGTTANATSAAGAPWKFVVVGDSRAPTGNTTTGISEDLDEIATAIAAERPSLLVFSGDLVSGWNVDKDSPVYRDYQAQFENWMSAMAPVHDYVRGTGVPVYVVRGNHEDGAGKTVPELRDAYLATVAQGMPANGPPGEVCLTYAFSHGGVRFIGLDEYVDHDGEAETVNQPWLDEELNTSPEKIRFVFGHAPAYSVEKGDEGDLSEHHAERDRFWTSLADHCVTAYLCGHSHLYSRGEALGVTQLVVGIGGAPPSAYEPDAVEPALNTTYPGEAVTAAKQPLGYVVVTVDPAKGTVSGTERLVDPATGKVTDGDAFALPAGVCR